ncbi:MAG: LysR family transcriptional regulator [Pseudomonadota bacterium]
MDWDKLRVFHAVADAGSLTHAGDQLRLSQSAISRQIRGLEEQLGATLFHRHARGLLLTEQGELLYKATFDISRRLTQAAAQIQDSKEEVFGDLRITTTAGFGTSWLASRLPALFEAHPDLSVSLILTEDSLDLGMREADVAIRFGEPTQADLIRRPLMQVQMRLYACVDYLKKHGQIEKAEDLTDHRLISFSPDAPQPEESRIWVASKYQPERSSHVTMNSYFGVLKAARAGLGVAALPDYVTHDYPEIVNVLPEDASPPFTIYFCYPEELRRSQRVLAFRDFLLGELARFTAETSPKPSLAASA